MAVRLNSLMTGRSLASSHPFIIVVPASVSMASPGEYRRGFVPLAVDGRTSAPHVGPVHDVIVEQSEVVEQLYGRGLVDGEASAVGTDRVGHGECEHRAYPFSSGLKRVAYRIV